MKTWQAEGYWRRKDIALNVLEKPPPPPPWSIPSKKGFASQVEIDFKQPVHVQTTDTQTD